MHHGAMAARQAKVLHIRANPDKEEKVPADLKSDALREKVSAFADEQSIQLEWYEEKRGTNKTSEALCKLVLHSDCDFIAIGSQGRKDNADPTHLGSTGAAPCKMMNGGCFVVKSGSKIPDGEPLTFVVCCDDSPSIQLSSRLC